MRFIEMEKTWKIGSALWLFPWNPLAVYHAKLPENSLDVMWSDFVKLDRSLLAMRLRGKTHIFEMGLIIFNFT